MKLYLTPEALNDLESIGEWIARDNPRRAVTFIEELESSCAEILNYPEKYPLTPQYEKQGLRRKVHGTYLIFYPIKATQVEVIHVLHGAKNLDDLL